MHHNKELDLIHFVADVYNNTQSKHTQKRIYFNKEILSIGYIPCSVGDQLKIVFSSKSDDGEIRTIKSFELVVTN